MLPVNPDLFSAFVAALPFTFLTKIKEAQPQIYKEAYHAAHDDPLLEQPEAEYVMPHMRRAIFETHFRKTANAAGLTASPHHNHRRTS